jgi:hypothetical protein
MSEITVTELIDGLTNALLDNAQEFTAAESLLIIRAAVQNGLDDFAVRFLTNTIANGV